jgi:CelD/BcsL family acetyltransferase involved in cellulose biosynthesis
MTYAISHLEGLGAVERLEPEWEALWHACPDATDTQLPLWQVAHTRLRAPRSTPIVVTARDAAGRLVALASFAISRDPGTLVRKATFLGDKAPDYHLILSVPSLPEAVGVSMLRHATDVLEKKGSFIELSNIPEASYSGRVLRELERSFGGDATLETWSSETFTVPLPETIDEYVGNLGQRSRRDFNYDRRRLARDFTVEYRVSSTVAEVEDALADIERVDRGRWGDDSRYAVESQRTFLRLLALELAAREMFRAHVLYADGRPVAYVTGAVVRNELKLHSIAHDPGFPSKYSVGKVANFLAIERSIEEGLSHYDLSRGGERYKEWLGGELRSNLHVRLYRSRFDAWFAQRATVASRLLRETTFLRRSYQRLTRR